MSVELKLSTGMGELHLCASQVHGPVKPALWYRRSCGSLPLHVMRIWRTQISVRVRWPGGHNHA